MKISICIFLMVAILAVYGQVRDHEFLNFDDPKYVTKNWNIKEGLTSEGVKWAFTNSYAANWHPVTWLSHMLDYQFYGLHPKGHLLTNVFIHIANSLLLFVVLHLMTGTIWQSGFVATLFALHPCNVESVAWVAERKNLLSTFFGLLSLLAYIRYTEKPTIKKYGLVALFLTLGLMSKPMLVTFPLVFLLLDFWPLSRLKPEKKNETNLTPHTENKLSLSRLVWEKTPLLVLIIGTAITTVIVQREGGALKSIEAFSMPERVNNALVAYISYLQKMVWPRGLSVFYAHPENALPAWKGIVSAVILVLVTIWVIRMARRAPYLLVGWFWYLGTLVPVIGIVQVGSQAMADRYAYIPLIGIFIMMSWGLPELMKRMRYKKEALFISGGILISILLVITWTQVGYWKNSITLYKHAISVTVNLYPSFSLVHLNLGAAQNEKGNFDEAIVQYKTAIKIKPNYGKAFNNLGMVFEQKGEKKKAIGYYMKAISIKPDLAEAYFNLGMVFDQKGEKKKAIGYYIKAISIKPDLAQAYYNLGNIYLKEEKIEEAIDHFKTALMIEPEFYLAHNSLGYALVEKGEMQKALQRFVEVKKLRPDFLPLRKYLERALLGANKVEDKATPLP